MKKMFMPLASLLLVITLFSCSSSRFASYVLNERDAAAAIRQMLEIGTRQGVQGAFSKDRVLSTLFPEPVKKVLNTVNQLGLTGEVDRFTTTLSTASEKAATASIPVFVQTINSMNLQDAMRLVKGGGTSATDYLRTNSGDNLRQALKPVMQSAIDEYKLNDQWNSLIKPIKGLAGNKLNLDLPTLMAGMVSEAMFQKIEEKEKEIRSQQAARSTNLLQKVFSKNW